MTEERTQYTTQPDELTQLRRQNRELSDKLDRQIAAWNANGDALTAHAERQAQRIAELEESVTQLTAQLIFMQAFSAQIESMIAERDRRIAELEATVARLEAEKRRLIAQIPYADLRYIVNSHPNLQVDMRIEAKRWLDTVKVPHD